MTTLLEYRTTLAYLAYLGFPSKTTNALKVSRPRKQDLKNGLLSRNVFLCFVFGALGSGKVKIKIERFKLRRHHF